MAMRSTEIVFFCMMYLLFFFMIGSLVGVTTFPPPPQPVKIGVWNLKFNMFLSFWDMALLLGTITAILVASIFAGIKVFGIGISFDQSFVVTFAIALFFGGLLAWTMTAMLSGVPLYISAVLVWPFVGILIYGIVSMARGGGG